MLPDRVSNPELLTYESGAPTDCATRPKETQVLQYKGMRPKSHYIRDVGHAWISSTICSKKKKKKKKKKEEKKKETNHK